MDGGGVGVGVGGEAEPTGRGGDGHEGCGFGAGGGVGLSGADVGVDIVVEPDIDGVGVEEDPGFEQGGLLGLLVFGVDELDGGAAGEVDHEVFCMFYRHAHGAADDVVGDFDGVALDLEGAEVGVTDLRGRHDLGGGEGGDGAEEGCGASDGYGERFIFAHIRFLLVGKADPRRP